MSPVDRAIVGNSDRSMDPQQELELAWKYAPILNLHPGEDYFPMDPQKFLEESCLWLVRKNKRNNILDLLSRKWKKSKKGIRYGLPGRLVASFPDTWGAEDLSWSRRPHDPDHVANRDRYVLEHRDKHPGDTFNEIAPPPCFYFVYEMSGSILISYWFFYGYSKFTRGVGHQGDWEHATFEIRNEELRSGCFAVHEDKHYIKSSDFDRIDGRVHIYSAKGRHATWWKQGEHFLWDPTAVKEEVEELIDRGLLPLEDETESGGKTWDVRQRLEPLREQSWRLYGGAWGDLGITAQGTGPLGPWYKRFLDSHQEVIVEKGSRGPARSGTARVGYMPETPGSYSEVIVRRRRRRGATAEIVFVHGRSQQGKDPDELKANWIAALRKGLARNHLELPISEDQIRFPYYGDTLHELTKGVAVKKASAISVREASRQDEATLTFYRSILEQYLDRKGVTDADLTDLARAEGVDRGALNWAPVQWILEKVDRHIPGASGKSIALFTQDVWEYLTDPDTREAIDGGVRLAIRRDVPTVLVAHSLGTVVAYSMLRREGGMLGWNIPLFVTLGSPLAVKAIRERMSPIRHPSCVDQWFNAMDKDDVVSLFPLDLENFKVAPPIENHTDVKNHTSNQHGIEGYLADKVVAERIYKALRSVGAVAHFG